MTKHRRLSAKARAAAEMEAAGFPVGDICERVPLARSTLRDLHGREDYRELVAERRAGLRAAAEAELGLARPEAVRALRGVLDAATADPGAVQPRDVLGAATALLNASAPPSRAVLERAEQAFMKRLERIDPDLAKRVAAAMGADDAAALASASMEELDAAIRGER